MYSSRAHPPSSKNYRTAATGSYRRFNSLRDAPPVVEGKISTIYEKPVE